MNVPAPNLTVPRQPQTAGSRYLPKEATRPPAWTPGSLNPRITNLTVLSFSAGQDSSALLAMYLHDRAFRQEYAPGNFMLMMACTQDEHDDTQAYTQEIIEKCKRVGIPFFFVTGDQGFHSGHWQKGLRGMWAATRTVGSVAFPSTCSPRLKTDALYPALAHVLRVEFGYDLPDREPLTTFAAERGKIAMWIGYGRGEESRVPKYAKAQPQLSMDFVKEQRLQPLWREQSIDLTFPLIDRGMDRKDCQDYLRDAQETIPAPSLCYSCHWKSPLLLLWSYRTDPERYMRWVADEARKIETWANEDFRRKKYEEMGKPEKFVDNTRFRNVGVSGKGSFQDGVFVPYTLLDALRDAEAEFGHMTLAQLEEQRMTNGHCNKSKVAS